MDVLWLTIQLGQLKPRSNTVIKNLRDKPLVDKSDREKQPNPADGRSKINELQFSHPAGQQAMVEVVRLSELRQRNVKVPIDRPARRDFHVIKLVTEEHGQHWVDYESVDLEQGDVLYLRPGQTHSFNRESRHEALLVVFRPEAEYDPTALQLIDPRSPKLKTTSVEFKSLVDIVSQIDSITKNKATFDVHQVSQWLLGALTAAVSQLASAQVQSNSDSRRSYLELINAFQQLMESHYADRHTITWFAEKLKTTERTLSRACKEVRGRSAKELLDTHTALEGRRQLLLFDDSVESIGKCLGFSETTNFVKFFRRVTGTTPAEFRSLWRASQ